MRIPAAGAEALREALFDSRQRWRDLMSMAGDMAFETDAGGRFVFIAPDTVIGWSASALIGQPAELLLAEVDGAFGFNPFRPPGPVRRRRAWLRRPDGGSVCMAFAAAPLLDARGEMIGARGVGQDVTEQDAHDAAMAASLRRVELLDHILWRMRQEVLAPRMMRAALEALVTALGAEGCAVIDMIGDGVEASVLHQIGHGFPMARETVLSLMETGATDPAQACAPDGRLVLVCPSRSRYGEQTGFALWRHPGGRPWDPDELMLAGSATGIIRVILEHDTIQREMARQARTDPLTGLINRRAFLDEVARRIERLEREGLPGTLLFVDLDNFKELNDYCGHETGDEALCITARLLRATVRPTDLVARLGGDEFALWLDGADEFAASERAERLREDGPKALGHLAAPAGLTLTMSIGIATRWPGRGEDLETTIRRADQAMYHVKRTGRGHWRVAHPGQP
jgi:diguanylate cyclase (GGDEF)-like protein/PAS domain S-box-containing protein